MEPKTPVSPALAGRFFTTRATWGALDCMKVKDSQSYLTLCNPMDYAVHGILQARILEWVAFPFSRGSSQPRDQTQVSHIANGFFASWASGKPKNTGVGSLFLLQGIFPTQNQTWVSCIARGIFTNWAIREALIIWVYTIVRIHITVHFAYYFKIYKFNLNLKQGYHL